MTHCLSSLLHQANAEVQMAVKTPAGLTDRQTITDSVLQGDTWGSILASAQVDSIGQECMEAGHYYLYKDKLPVGFLGLVDDIVSISEAGYKAQQQNVFLNLKTAEKSLKFGVKKCKSLLISKNKSDFYSDLMVDKWEVKYEDNPLTGDLDLVEEFCGQTRLERVDKQMYLGFVISSVGDNMANIEHVKNKSIGIVKKIFNKLNSLHLKQYYFECSKIFLNVLLRPSILYASEAYYNLKESEIRQLERIEENFLRNILNTSKGCPIVQLYLELGHIPARVEIQKIRLMYLQYILHQSDESSLSQFFKLQFESPTRGDWASRIIQDLKDWEIFENFEAIKVMSKNKFSNILKGKIRTISLKYLTNKQGKKGKDIKYSSLEMADYLLPTNKHLNLEEKRTLFALRNKMVDIPNSFSNKELKEKCFCGEIEEMEHLYECEILGNNSEIPYDKIYSNNVKDQIEVFRRMEKKNDERIGNTR